MEYIIGAAIGAMVGIIIGIKIILPKKQYQRRCSTCEWFGTSSGYDDIFDCYNSKSLRYRSFVTKQDHCKHWEKRS